MKNWFTTNMGLKILSVFFAVGLWMIVVNIDDPVTTKTFKNIPVVFENETVLSDAGLVYQVLDGSNSVSFTFFVFFIPIMWNHLRTVISRQ